jgi:hypothetical protein
MQGRALRSINLTLLRLINIYTVDCVAYKGMGVVPLNEFSIYELDDRGKFEIFNFSCVWNRDNVAGCFSFISIPICLFRAYLYNIKFASF